MAYTKVSIPKKGTAPGTPSAKSPNIIIIDVADIETMPTREEGDVVATGELALKADAKAIAIYATRSTIKRYDTMEGDADAKGFIANLEFEHPGDEAEINSFLEYYANRDVAIITTECASETGGRLQGTPCNPMQLTLEEQDDNEAKKKIIKFAQAQRDGFKTTHYNGALPTLAAETPSDPEEEEGGDGL